MCMTIKEKYIDPFTDFGFKWIFGTEENKELLISFLNDILELESPIVDVEYRNLEKLGLKIGDRRAIFDIYCTDSNQDQFIVELQRSKQRYFKDRSIYYTSFPIQSQSQRGDWDYSLKKTYFIGILEFRMDESSDNYITKVQLCDVETKEVFYNKLTYIYIEMPKFTKSQQELSSHLDYWLYTLNNMNALTHIPPILKEDRHITQAFDVAEFLALDEDEQFAYQHDLKTRLDYKNAMDYAKETAREDGLREGRDEGLEEGMKKGMEKGIEKGEYNKALEIAKNLKASGVEVETIATVTGLSIEEIDEA